MTTDRIIEIFNDYDRISGTLIRGNSEDDSLFNSETVEAMNSISVILHKYQKIEQILDDWENSGEEDDPINIIDNIGEVIEDGNDNN